MAKQDFISSLNKFISKTVDDNLFDKFGKVTEYISFGNYMLNAQMSGSLFGGLPNTRSLELAGSSGTGKTFLCLNLVKGMVEKGYHVYYIDTEGALDEDMFERFGISEQDVTHIRQLNTFQGVINFVNAMVEGVRREKANNENPDDLRVALVLDSLGMLNTETELENAIKGKYAEDMGKRAKIIRSFFRTITLPIANYSIPFVYTNHTSANLDMFAIDKEVTAGGEGATYSAGSILILQKMNYMKDTDKARTGLILRSRPKKNRSVQPRDVEFHLSFVQGMNPYIGLKDYLSWDNCGVEAGAIYTQEEFEKKFKKTPTNASGKELRVEKWSDAEGNWVAVLNPNARTLAVKSSHSNESFDDIYTDKIFTEQTLRDLDKNIIKPMFEYSSPANESSKNIAEMLEASIKTSNS